MHAVVMVFEVEHTFDASIERVEEAMFHPDYYAFLVKRRDLLDDVRQTSRQEDEREIRRETHYKPRPVFERIGPKKIPPEWFEFIERSVWNKKAQQLTFENVPCTGKVARRFRNRGTIELEEVAPGETVRRARAELELHNLPLMLRPLAGVAEQMIAREARKLLEAEARALAEWLKASREAQGAATQSVGS